jgi:hypothetical protein
MPRAAAVQKPLRECAAAHAGQSAEDVAAVRVRMADNGARCERCLEFQDEVRSLRERMAASGKYVTHSPGPDLDRELQR